MVNLNPSILIKSLTDQIKKKISTGCAHGRGLLSRGKPLATILAGQKPKPPVFTGHVLQTQLKSREMETLPELQSYLYIPEKNSRKVTRTLAKTTKITLLQNSEQLPGLSEKNTWIPKVRILRCSNAPYSSSPLNPAAVKISSQEGQAAWESHPYRVCLAPWKVLAADLIGSTRSEQQLPPGYLSTAIHGNRLLWQA